MRLVFLVMSFQICVVGSRRLPYCFGYPVMLLDDAESRLSYCWCGPVRCGAVGAESSNRKKEEKRARDLHFGLKKSKRE